jgi:hypothetical protein
MSEGKMTANITRMVLGCAIAAALIITACREDDPVTPPPRQTSSYKSLQNKDDVLFNLELAYNKRNFEQFAQLLDDEFVFVLSETDYNSGEVDVPQWDRVRELKANQQIFDPNLSGGRRVIGIELSLDYTDDQWTPEPPDTNHPTETWYKQTVAYDLVTKTADDWEHRALDLQAEFKIRKDDATGHWQIVLWRDDVRGNGLSSSVRRVVEETTWGSIKSLYD